MMEITCDECGKKYRIDESKIKAKTARLKCKACGNIIVAVKPEPEPEEVVDFEAVPPGPSPAPRPAPRPAAAEPPPPREAAAVGGPAKVRFGLFPKIILIMLIVSLVPLGIFWAITFTRSTDRIRNDTERFMAETAEGLSRQVDEWLDKNIRVMKAVALLPDVVSMDRIRQEPVMKAVAEEYPWMYLVFTVGPEGMNVARNDGKPLKDYSDRQYYKDVIQGKDLSWQTLIGKTSKKPALVIAVPIKSGGRLVGVMACAATIDDISRNVARWRQGRTGFAFLVDEKGKVVSHQIKQYVLSQKNLASHPLVAAIQQSPKAKTLQFTQEGKQVLGHVRSNDFGWALAIQQNTEEVFEDLEGVRRFAIILLAVTIVVVSLIAWLFARAVVKPVMKLTDVAERMSLGELNVKIDIKSKDEIGLLARAIGRMQTSLSLAMERLRRKR